MSKTETLNSKIKLISFLKPYWKYAILSPIGMAIEAIAELQLPALMAVIVDSGVLVGDMSVVSATAFKMSILLFLSILGGILAAYTSTYASQSYGMDLRNALYMRIMSLPVSETDKFTTGSLVTRLTNDVNVIQDFIVMVLRMFVRTPIQFFGGIVMMLVLNAKFGIIMICTLPLQILIVAIIAKKANPLYSVTQKELDRVNSVTQENISGARVVKAYVREEYEEARFNKINFSLTQAQYKVQKLISKMAPLMMIVMNIAVVALIYMGGLAVEAREMQVGHIMAGVTYLTQVLSSLMQVAMIVPNYSRSMASGKRVDEVLAADSENFEHTKTPNKDCSIEFSNVSFAYPDSPNKPVLENINLTIAPGETLAILGSTGSGKSTLIKLISHLYDATEGVVKIDGEDVREYNLTALRNIIGSIPQKNELFSGTIGDNLRWGNKNATQAEIEAAAKTAQAHQFISEFSGSYETIIGAKGSSLSGGQKQRLCIARALLKHPQILIMDDSTSALDLGTEARLQAALKTELAGMTVIIIAQRIASVKNADRIAVLEDGKLVACGTHNQLIINNDIYKNIYDSQIYKGDELL